MIRDLIARFTAQVLIVVIRGLTAARAVWHAPPETQARVYYANHTSHADFVLLWAVLPPPLRARTRPVAASEYWLASRIRRFLAHSVFRSVLIDRERTEASPDPIHLMSDALETGDSLVIFPEGTRNISDTGLLPFKSGLYRLAQAQPQVEFVPVWIANLNRVLPKGERIPVPLICTVTFGEPLKLATNESQVRFLERARQALSDLAPNAQTGTESVPS